MICLEKNNKNGNNKKNFFDVVDTIMSDPKNSGKSMQKMLVGKRRYIQRKPEDPTLKNVKMKKMHVLSKSKYSKKTVNRMLNWLFNTALTVWMNYIIREKH